MMLTALAHRSEVGVLYDLQLTRDISMTVVQLSFRIIRSVYTHPVSSVGVRSPKHTVTETARAPHLIP